MSALYKKSVLINAFEIFYIMVSKKIEFIKKDTFFSVSDQQEKDKQVAQLQNELSVFIKDQNTEVAQEGGKLASDSFQEVVYIMVALADELFLDFEWDGRNYWRKHSLEQKFFGTNKAGEKLLQDLDVFMKSIDVNNKEIGLLYLSALSLGFKGKLRYEENFSDCLKTLKENLYQIVYKRSSKLYQKQIMLFEQTQENLIIDKLELNKFIFYNWKNISLIALGVYLFFSHLTWYLQTYETQSLVREFNKLG